MKTTLMRLLALQASASMPLAAAIYVSDFTAIQPTPLIVDGEHQQDGEGNFLYNVYSLEDHQGWELSVANNFDTDESGELYEAYRAFGSTLDGVPAAAVGGYYDEQSTVTGAFYAYRNLAVDLTSNFSFSMDFGITEATSLSPYRTVFNVGFYNGSDEVFSLILNPLTHETVAESPLGDGVWTVQTSTGGMGAVSTTLAAQPGQRYVFEFSSAPDGAYNFSVSNPSLGSSVSGVGELDAGSITELRVGMGLAGSNTEYGDDTFIFSGINAIPEPSAVLLVAFSAMAGVFHRRRC